MREPAKQTAPDGGLREAPRWQGRELVDRLGHKVGRIEALFADAETQTAVWAAVRTGLPSTRRTLVPITQARPVGERAHVPFDKQHMMQGPRFFEPDNVVARAEHARLCRHYGIARAQTRPDDGTPERRASAAEGTEPRSTATARKKAAAAGPNGARPEARVRAQNGATTGSEADLRVGTARRERGGVQLRNYVVAEDAEYTVPTRREEIRSDYQPIAGELVNGAEPGPEVSTDEYEGVLHEEVPVVEKRVVPREQVRVAPKARAYDAEVTEEVRTERIEADGTLAQPPLPLRRQARRATADRVSAEATGRHSGAPVPPAASSPRRHLARAALKAACSLPQVAAGVRGTRRVWVTGDDDGGLLEGVVAAARVDGRYDVDLHLVVQWPVGSLYALADEVRGRVARAADRGGLAHAVGDVSVSFEDIQEP